MSAARTFAAANELLAGKISALSGSRPSKRPGATNDVGGGGGGGSGSGSDDDANAPHLVDMHLLHLACDADPASGTRAPDVRTILRLTNGIERSIVEGEFLPNASDDGGPRKKRAKTAPSENADAHADAVADEEASRRIEARIRRTGMFPETSGDLSARAPLFVDAKDGRTPLHRACAPPKADVPNKKMEDALMASSASSGADELEAALLNGGDGDNMNAISDISDVDDDDDEDESQAVTTSQSLAPIARPKSDAPKTVPETRKHRADTAWLFESACLLLGLCPGMASIRDSSGETPLHILSRGTYDPSDALAAATARSMLQYQPGLTRIKDAWGNTPLHRRVLTLLDAFDPPSRQVEAGPILAARAAAAAAGSGSGIYPMQATADGLASQLIASDPAVLLQPNGAGLTPLHLACKYRSTARNPAVVYDLLREMALFCPDAVALPDAGGERSPGFNALHYLCEASHASLPLIEVLLDVEGKFQTARLLGLLPPRGSSSAPTTTSTAAATATTALALALEPPASPSVLLRDKRGFTPLHLACLDRAPLPVLRALLNRAPSASLVREEWGRTALDVMWSAHGYHVSRVRDAMDRFDGDKDFAALRRSVLGEEEGGGGGPAGSAALASAAAHATAAHRPGHFWAKVVELARAMASSSGCRRGGVPLSCAPAIPELHAVVAADCPVEIVEVAMRVYPRQLRLRDAVFGDLPVHAAAAGRRRDAGVPKDYERRWRREERRRARRWLGQDGDEEDEVFPPPPEGEEDVEPAVDEDEDEDFSVVVSGASLASHCSAGSASSSSSGMSTTSGPGAFAEYSASSDEESVASGGSLASSSSSASVATTPSTLSVINEDASADEKTTTKKKKSRAPSSALEILLDVDPESALLPSGRTGRLPLHCALASGRTWSSGVRAIVRAGPAAVGMVDPFTGLFPFMLAAASATEAASSEMTAVAPAPAREAHEEDREEDDKDENEHELRALNTSFVLLHCRPEVVATGIIN